jgi:hypothetical protein
MGFNNVSKNKVLFLFVISAFLILMNTGCTRKAGGISTLQIALPTSLSSYKISDFNVSSGTIKYESTSATDSGPNWNSSLNPITMADVNCYLIAVSGPEADMQRNYCTTTSGEILRIGRWVGGVLGPTFTMEVPSGPARKIMVIGFKSQSGACTNFKNTDVNGQSLSEPHVLGWTTKDLSTGTVAVDVPVPMSVFSATMLKIKDCKGPDFNSMGAAALYFGDNPTGNTHIVSNSSYTAMGGYSE